MSDHTNNVVKEIKYYILTFIMALSIIVASICVMGKYSMLSGRAIIHCGDRVDFYQNLKEEIDRKATDLAIPYGINKKCIKNVFSGSQIRKDMKQVLDDKLEGKNTRVDVSKIDQQLTANVVKLEGKLNAKQKASLKSYIVKLCEYYQTKVHFPTEDVMVTLVKVSTKVAWFAIPAGVLIAIVLGVYMVVSRKMAYRGLRFVTYGILAAGAFLTVVFAALISEGSIYRINVSDAYMRRYYTFWIGHEMLMLVFTGIGILLAGLIFVYIVVRQKSNYR